MIADHVDFFDCQAGAKIYLHTLFVSIWDLLYKSGRLLEESLNVPYSRYYSKGVHKPLTKEEDTLVSFIDITMKEVKTLVPEPSVLEHLKRTEKYLARRVLPLKNDLAYATTRMRAAMVNIAETQENYAEDVRTIHKFCDIVSGMTEERRVKNEEQIKTDLTTLVFQTNPKEEVLLKARVELDDSVIGLRDRIREMAIMIKKLQIDSSETDYTAMVKADSALADILMRITVGIKDISKKVDEIINLGFDTSHKKKIEDEYNRRSAGLYHIYNPAWKPFADAIREFDTSDDAHKVSKLVYSFRHLLDSIEWSFDIEHIEHSYVPILLNMQRMRDLLLAKTQEIEYTRVRPDDSAHPLTEEFIKFYHKIFSHMCSTIADVFYLNPAHANLAEVLNLRIAFFDELKVRFKEVRAKFEESKKNYYVGEYWKTLSSQVYDFMERVYTANVHQKLKINEAFKQLLVDLRHNIEYIVKEMSQFHSLDTEALATANSNYQKLLVDTYNRFVQDLKANYATVHIEEGYQLDFVKNQTVFRFHPSLLYTAPGQPVEYSIITNIPPPPVTGDSPWKINRIAVPEVTKIAMKEEIDKSYHYFNKAGYDWIKVKTMKIPEYSMDDLLNIFFRNRTIKCDGQYYESFADAMMILNKEKPISIGTFDPPFETEILPKASGHTYLKAVKEKPMKISIPFFPPTFQTHQTVDTYMFSPSEVYYLARTDSKGIPGGDAFHVLSCIEMREFKEPNFVTLDMNYCLVFTASSMTEGAVRTNVPIEVTNSFNLLEETLSKVVKENQPNVAEKNPNKKIETNNVFDKKILMSAQFKNIKDRTEELFAPASGSEQRRKRLELEKKRRYLGEYDKRAIYHSGPEALNPDFEDIFNVPRATQTKTELVTDFINTIKDKNLGAIEEFAEKNREIIEKVQKDPRKYVRETKEQLKNWKILLGVGIVITLILLKYYGY